MSEQDLEAAAPQVRKQRGHQPGAADEGTFQQDARAAAQRDRLEFLDAGVHRVRRRQLAA